MATIKDVARQSGVSVATVSRVLNESGYFDEETGRRVREAVVALGYQRNIHWSRLSRNSSETICFLLGNRAVLNSMQMRLLVSCEQALQTAGYDLVFARFSYRPDERAVKLKLPRILSQPGMVDGVILAGVHYANILEALPLPAAVLGNTLHAPARWLKHSAVIYDDVAGAYEAMLCLLRLGHRHIAFVGDTRLPWFQRRFEGYQRALREHGLPEHAVRDDWGTNGIEYGQLATQALLRTAQPPTAIFAANDELAAGVWKELVKRGIAIPRQMSLMGFGDREEFSILEPALTTVNVYPERLGEQLARLLLERLKQPAEQIVSRVFPCRVTERASCGPPRSRLQVVSG